MLLFCLNVFCINGTTETKVFCLCDNLDIGFTTLTGGYKPLNEKPDTLRMSWSHGARCIFQWWTCATLWHVSFLPLTVTCYWYNLSPARLDPPHPHSPGSAYCSRFPTRAASTVREDSTPAPALQNTPRINHSDRKHLQCALWADFGHICSRIKSYFYLSRESAGFPRCLLCRLRKTGSSSRTRQESSSTHTHTPTVMLWLTTSLTHDMLTLNPSQIMC